MLQAFTSRAPSLTEELYKLALGRSVMRSRKLILRNNRNDEYRRLLTQLRADTTAPEMSDKGAFATGLYVCTELFVEGLLDLYRAGVLKREPTIKFCKSCQLRAGEIRWISAVCNRSFVF